MRHKDFEGSARRVLPGIPHRYGHFAPQTSTRVVRIFPNREACLRLVTALAIEHSEEWVTGRRYLDMRELEEHSHLKQFA